MSLHGVFHKSRVFDPTCLFEAKAMPMIQQNCLFHSDIVNYADIENLYRTTKILIGKLAMNKQLSIHGQ